MAGVSTFQKIAGRQGLFRSRATRGMWRALRNDDIRQAEKFIADGANIAARNGHGQTPLHYAADKMQSGLARRLIELGAEIDPRAGYGRTPLFLAVSGHWSGSGREEIVRVLIEAGADVRLADTDEVTPLHVSCKMGDIEVTRRLLAAGADMTARTKQGNMPLNRASESSRAALLACFLDAGLDADKAIVADGRNALQYSASLPDPQLLKRALAASKNIAATDSNGHNALHQAAIARMPRNFKPVCDAGLDVNARDNDGNTALHLAIISGNLRGCLALTALGARTDIANNAGTTPLELAPRIHGMPTKLAVWLLSGASTSPDDPDLLTEAVRARAADWLALLEEKGADINAAQGRALRTAVSMGYADMVAELLDLGADPMAGKGAALDGAICREGPEVLQAFLDSGIGPEILRGRAALLMRGKPLLINGEKQPWLMALVEEAAAHAATERVPPQMGRRRRKHMEALQEKRKALHDSDKPSPPNNAP
jgi:ankyrin repeat protein